MKVSGFTFVRNAIKYDYPVVESITSILPICDEFIVAVGNSDDSTLELILSINSPKIKIIATVWDESQRKDGRVLSIETNKAFNAIASDSDWAFYIQADEVFHEKDLPAIKEAMLKWVYDKRVEGLLFRHLNLYGSYDYIASSRKWQKNEIRIIRNDHSISSYKDAMSFRKNGRKLRVIMIDACIYHYGWVRNPNKLQDKLSEFHKFWHDDQWIEENISKDVEFDFSKIDSLSPFTETHPMVMMERIKNTNWTFEFDPLKSNKLPLRLRILNYIYLKTGWLIGGFKNYKLLKHPAKEKNNYH